MSALPLAAMIVRRQLPLPRPMRQSKITNLTRLISPSTTFQQELIASGPVPARLRKPGRVVPRNARPNLAASSMKAEVRCRDCHHDAATITAATIRKIRVVRLGINGQCSGCWIAMKHFLAKSHFRQLRLAAIKLPVTPLCANGSCSSFKLHDFAIWHCFWKVSWA